MKQFLECFAFIHSASPLWPNAWRAWLVPRSPGLRGPSGPSEPRHTDLSWRDSQSTFTWTFSGFVFPESPTHNFNSLIFQFSSQWCEMLFCELCGFILTYSSKTFSQLLLRHTFLGCCFFFSKDEKFPRYLSRIPARCEGMTRPELQSFDTGLLRTYGLRFTGSSNVTQHSTTQLDCKNNHHLNQTKEPLGPKRMQRIKS